MLCLPEVMGCAKPWDGGDEREERYLMKNQIVNRKKEITHTHRNHKSRDMFQHIVVNVQVQ